MTTTTTKLTAAQKRAATLKAKNEAEYAARVEREEATKKENAAFLVAHEDLIASMAADFKRVSLECVGVVFANHTFVDKWARVGVRASVFDFGFAIEDSVTSRVQLEVVISVDAFTNNHLATTPKATINVGSSGSHSISDTHRQIQMMTTFLRIGSILEEKLYELMPHYNEDYRLLGEAINRAMVDVNPVTKAHMDAHRASVGE